VRVGSVTAMTRYFAFLRALNVGGHTVRMTDLKVEFEALGFADVGTFIASGNVIFEASGGGAGGAAALERRIESRLRDTLGYEVRTFLRTDAELGAIHDLDPFPGVTFTDGDTLQVCFLPEPPAKPVRDAIRALSSDLEHLDIVGRELYWLIHGTSLETAITPGVLKRTFDGMPFTARNVNTVRRLATKYRL